MAVKLGQPEKQDDPEIDEILLPMSTRERLAHREKIGYRVPSIPSMSGRDKLKRPVFVKASFPTDEQLSSLTDVSFVQP